MVITAPEVLVAERAAETEPEMALVPEAVTEPEAAVVLAADLDIR